jgi:biotin carboxylase
MRVVFGRPEGPAHCLEHSRDIDAVWAHPPVRSPRFIAALEEYCRTVAPDYIFPLGDDELAVMALLGPVGLSATVVSASPQLLELCQQKEQMLLRAAALGIATKPWTSAQSVADLHAAATRIGFPLVLKATSAGGNDGGESAAFVGCKAKILEDASALESFLRGRNFPRSGVLVQGRAKGLRHNVYFVAWHGELRGVCETVTLRTDRIDGTGLGVEGISVAPSPRLLAQARLLAADVGYTGVGCAQFLVDPDDGSSCFLELNGRLGANTESIVAAGLDLPRLFLELMHGDIPMQPAARVGRRYAWLGGDVDGLLDSRRQGLIGTRDGLKWIARMLLAQLRADNHITFSWRDPMPTLHILTRRFGSACVSALRSSGR